MGARGSAAAGAGAGRGRYGRLARGALACGAVAGLAQVAPAAGAAEPPLGPLLHPAGPGSLRWRAAASAELDVLPRSLVESELRYLPRLGLAARLGLPAGFTADLVLSGNVFFNDARLGPAWAIELGPLAVGLRDRVGLFYGAVGLAGFDTSTWGVLQVPGFGVGIEVERSHLALHGDLVLCHARAVRYGEVDVHPSFSPLSAAIVGLSVETPVYRDHEILYGLDVVYANADYQLWMVFSDARGAQLYPRFFLGYGF